MNKISKKLQTNHLLKTNKAKFSNQFILLFFFVIFVINCNPATKEDYILIYDGKIADKDGVEKVTLMAEEYGFPVLYISNLKKLNEDLDKAKAFVIGGTEGDTGDLLEDLYEVQDELKAYINAGGNYLGICGGAYVASKGSQWTDGYETGMGLINIECFAYDPQYTDPQIITINWLGEQRTIYYQYGPAFAYKNLPSNCEVLARYTNPDQDVAAFLASSGAGKVILVGPHPEADESWLVDDPPPLHASMWTNTHDIFHSIFEKLVAD